MSESQDSQAAGEWQRRRCSSHFKLLYTEQKISYLFISASKKHTSVSLVFVFHRVFVERSIYTSGQQFGRLTVLTVRLFYRRCSLQSLKASKLLMNTHGIITHTH